MTPRSFPYLWVTWLTGLLAGDDLCEWAAWFKAHYQGYAKVRNGDGAVLVQWKADHADQVRQRAAELSEAGWTVYLEKQNRLKLRGHVAELGGVADIVAVILPPAGDTTSPVPALIVDVKSGRERDKDVWQVFVYMRFLPLVHPVLKAFKGRLVLHGEVRYPHGAIEFNEKTVTEKTKGRIEALIKKLALIAEPARVPSEDECLYCDIGPCPVRVKSTKVPDQVVEPDPDAGF